MSMKTIKVAETTDTQLDWLVAKREGVLWLYETLSNGSPPGAKYTTDWSLMGPIIEREGINTSVDYQDDVLSDDMVQIGWKGNLWNNSVPGTAGFLQWSYGPTPLIAAARCYVASKLGETVEVPEELV